MADVQQAAQAAEKKPLEITPDVRAYLESILVDAGAVTLDEASHEEMIKELFVRLDSYIISVIVDRLPDEYVEEFVKMNENGKSQVEVEKFLQDKLPDAQQVFTDLFGDFRDTYLRGVVLERNKPSNTGMTVDKYIAKNQKIVN